MIRIKNQLLAMAFLLVTNYMVFAQTFPLPTNVGGWYPNASVNSFAEDLNHIYISGTFSSVIKEGVNGTFRRAGGVASAGGVGAITSSLPAISQFGTIHSSTSDGNGGWYLGGNFTVPGLSQRSLIHIKADKTLDTGFFCNLSGTVFSVVKSDTNLFIGGDFIFNPSGVTYRNLVKASANTGNVDLNWNANIQGVGSSVRAIVAVGTDIFVGGNFTNVGGRPRNHLAKFSIATGMLDTDWNPSLVTTNNIPVRALAFSSAHGWLAVGGSFTEIGGLERTNIALISPTNGAANANWNANANGIVNSFTTISNAIYVGGEFTNIGGQARNRLAMLSMFSGTAVLVFNPNPNGVINCITIQGDFVYVSGTFTAMGNMSVNRVARFSSFNSSLDITWMPASNGTINTISATANEVMIAGALTSLGGLPRGRIARFNKNDFEVDMTWNPNVEDNAVLAMTISGTDVYIAGNFTRVAGQTRNRIARVSTTGSGALSPWNPNANQTVRAMQLLGTELFVGGDFTNIGGRSRNRIAVIFTNDTGTADAVWNPNADAGVNTLLLDGSNLYVGGSFNSIGGQGRNRLARISTGGSGVANATWNPLIANGIVNTLHLIDTNLFVGGSFNEVAGSTLVGIAKISTNGAGAADTSWNPKLRIGGDAFGVNVNRMISSGSDLYVVGSFNNVGVFVNGDIYAGAARISMVDTGLVDNTWRPRTSNGTPIAIFKLGNNIYIGGTFSNTVDNVFMPNLGVFPDDVSPSIFTSVSFTPSDLAIFYGNPSSAYSFNVSGVKLTNGITITAPAGYEVSFQSNANFANSISYGTTGFVPVRTIFFRLKADLPVGNNYAGNVIVSSMGLTDILIATPNINVVPKPLIVTGLSASDKIYDGSTTATITGTPVLVGLVGSDVVTLTGTPIGNFYDSLPGTMSVKVSGLSLTGPNAANYTLRELWLDAYIYPNAPSNLTAVVRPYPNVELNWNDIVGEEKYQIFRKTATDTGYTQISEVTANTTTYTDTGLTSGVTYFYVIRGFVLPIEGDDTLFSANSNEASVLVTMPSSLQTVSGNSFSIYPNPSADRVFFTLPNISGEVAIHITDLQGKLISTQVQNVQLNEVASISLQHLKTGNYYIQFVTPQGVIVKPIIKE